MARVFKTLTGKPRTFFFGTIDGEWEKHTREIGWGVYDGEKYSFFKTVHEMLQAVLSPQYYGMVFFAHFGGKADFAFMLDELESGKGWDIEAVADSGISRIICTKRGPDGKSNGRIVLADSFKLLPMSLEEAGKAFKVEHQKIEIGKTETVVQRPDGTYEYSSNMEGAWSKDVPDWKTYLEYDCLCLYECLQAFYSYIIGWGGSMKLTIASSAMDIFRRRFMEKALYVPSSQAYEPELRQAYRGGRCEVFKLEGKDLLYYDVNSMYPYVMTKTPVPVGTWFFHTPSIDIPGASLAIVDVPKRDNLPAVTVKRHGKLVSPVGRIKDWFMNCELRYFRELDYKVRVLDTIANTEERVIFNDYVSFFYPIKKQAKAEGNKGMEIVSKLLLNGLYGKFGQRREMESIVLDDDMSKHVGERPANREGTAWLKPSLSGASFILVGIPATITAEARTHLHRFIKQVGKGHVYYTDTDSVVTDQTLPVGQELGELKLEASIQYAQFNGPKNYCLVLPDGRAELKCKGIPRQVLRFIEKHPEKVRSGELISITAVRRGLFGIRESKRRTGSYLGAGEIKRTATARVDKREVLPDGLNTRPIRVRA